MRYDDVGSPFNDDGMRSQDKQRRGNRDYTRSLRVCGVHPALNPFSPGSGLQPPLLAGREGEIASFDLIVARSRNSKLSPSLVLHGYRGVGKTVLLNAMRGQAERAGWLCIDIEAQSTKAGVKAVRQRLGRKLHDAAEQFKNGKAYSESVRKAFGTLTGFSISLGVVALKTVREPANGRAQSGELEVDLEELVEDFAAALRESGTAIGVFIDEMQDLDSEMLSALLSAQNRAGQKNIPFYVVGAGLPSLPSLLGKSRSYSERLFDYRQIDALAHDAARAAVEEPFGRANMRFDEQAVECPVEEANGYPYFLQVFGHETWDTAQKRQIDLDTVHRGIQLGYKKLDQGFFPARWDRATKAERNYMRAMADIGTRDCMDSDIADAHGTSAVALTRVRKSLIDKGIIFRTDHDKVAFTVPGMPAFIGRQEAVHR